ncbi:fatty acid hydroxylase family protein [Erythrobacteraceae bacterium CFH 75059]|uniref:sterol desaturase family protein n=1 Tax=Qipengyuania thermophila TaxID=2509361 RepID=UPI001021B5D0|nr:sterol desaturase family protein [Qipengyuania thermophila]TCD06646.1 fatty acid hydroxylase family protein [Erythrobacteraceae bacterium CFH 75059]
MSTPAALLVALLATTVIVAVRYLLVSGALHWLTLRLRPGHVADLGAQIRREIGWSMSAAAIYGALGGLMLWAWHHLGATRIYTDWSAFPWWYAPLSLAVYLLVHDTWFYWTHRLLHRPALFRRYHAVHHAGRRPTAWTAMSFHPGESLVGAAILPALVFVVPVHVAVLGLVLTIMTVFGATNHLGWEIFPGRLVKGPVGRWVITASHHQRHHENYRCNYGLYFRHWDRWCGTDRGLSAALGEEKG